MISSTLSLYVFAISYLAFRRLREAQRLGPDSDGQTSHNSQVPMQQRYWSESRTGEDIAK